MAINTKKLIKDTVIGLFFGMEIGLYALFLIDDFIKPIGIDNSLVKFFSIILVNAFSIGYLVYAFIKKENILERLLTSFALICTLCADVFLLYLNRDYEIGLIFFIVTQITYFISLYFSIHESFRNMIIKGAVRFSAFLILLMVIFSNFKENIALYVLVDFYFVNLVGNFVDSFINIFRTKGQQKKSFIVLTIGFELFICCDICVGLYNLNNIANEFIWLFYLPSQVLIALSSIKTLGYGIYENKEQ